MGYITFEAAAYMDGFSLITIVIQGDIHSVPSITLHHAENISYPLTIEKEERYHHQRIYKCRTPLTMDVSNEYWVDVCGNKIAVKLGRVVRTEEFDAAFFDDGALGALYSEGFTTFKVWSPVAKEMRLIFRENNDEYTHEVSMEKTKKGVWTYRLSGDHHLTEYLYKAKVNHEWVIAADPYARSVTVNGEKSVVLNMSTTDPENWNRSEKKMNLRSKLETLIYELHIRDFTIHADSGVKDKGKYLGLTEKGTKTSLGNSTGLDYLKSLGVSHIQLMPVADFGSVDETKPDEQYNWGYDPVHLFSPEGSYATNPYDPVCRVKELKMMIQALHQNGLSVILDVVFNHVYKREESSFEKLVPGYFFRYDDGGKPVNGTGVGNDTASERKMMRKFIVDCLVYWMTEYKVDGFRFDLMGIHDVETMNIAANKLKSLNPSLFLLGEGWNLNTNLPLELKASLSSAKKMPAYSFFNDTFRDSVKGSIFPEGRSGFINGNLESNVLNQLNRSIRGCSGNTDTFLTPEQSINYTECHDNHTLYDLLSIRHYRENDDFRKKRQHLALAFTLFSRGVPFIHAGQEIYRTKFGIENSYNSPDRINALNWLEFKKYEKCTAYFRELIKLRKEQPVFHKLSSTIYDRSNISKGIFGVEIHLSSADKKEREFQWGKVLLLFNSSIKIESFSLKSEYWTIAVEDEKYNVNRAISESYQIKPLSFSLLYQS
ncbi:type I pullulanase [Fictibacillus barbaricus]|uniref:Pullulanase n=1 Tax=Fictibacillus barbaricus TaxID=182136 RepID=A0ABU1U2W4_9BACL|nr:type I pullulanase [Fictibacillus barbaricus]MDR7073838.1 pullulanase [Fictibacillus barbaricus]